MTKLILKYIWFAIFVAVILFSAIKIINSINHKQSITSYDNTIDSLNNIITNNNSIISKNKIVIDSLSNHKSQIINNYETTIKNYSNPTLVSDDSISRYISKELYNWK